MRPTQYITREYRKQRKFSLRAFAEALGNGSQEISHQTIKNWEDGTNEPDFSFVMTLVMKTRDWRMDFALDLLAAMKPEIYEPMTSIGRRAIEKYSVSKTVSNKVSEQEKEK